MILFDLITRTLPLTRFRGSHSRGGGFKYITTEQQNKGHILALIKLLGKVNSSVVLIKQKNQNAKHLKMLFLRTESIFHQANINTLRKFEKY